MTIVCFDPDGFTLQTIRTQGVVYQEHKDTRGVGIRFTTMEGFEMTLPWFQWIWIADDAFVLRCSECFNAGHAAMHLYSTSNGTKHVICAECAPRG